MTHKISNFFLLFVLIAVFLISNGCDSITDPDQVTDPTIPDTYGDPVWQDEFDLETLDDSKWGYDLGYGSDGWGNDEWQLYTNSSDNIRVEDGNLVISAVWDSSYTAPGKRDDSITSARIKTQNKFSFKYGKVRAKIKAPTGTGMWPAFWMLGNNIETAGWPNCGEIDIMEISPLLHGENTTMSTMHWWDESLGDAGAYNTYGTSYDLNESLSDDYHIYEVEWDEQRIMGKIDNITYFTKVIDPITMNEFFQNYFLIFNVAVGGNLGGTPNDSTVWPQEMFVDWIRVFQPEQIPIDSFGIFTEETPVDAGLEIGVNAEIYVWENTLTAGTLDPIEGVDVISWQTTGSTWFGGGISSNTPVDLSTFEDGTLNFQMKMPENVTFKIGITDTQGNENYVLFPANQTAYGLVRNGEWGQAIIPVSELKGSVDLQSLSYEFAILEQGGVQCEFAIDDIYYDSAGLTATSVSFDADTYSLDDTSAEITVIDEDAASTTVSTDLSNGTETISIEITLDENGFGTGTINFGPTDDPNDTIAIVAGGSITISYTDSNGTVRTDSASIDGGSGATYIGIYSESHTEQMLAYTAIINSADWSGNSTVPDEQSTAVTPVDGTYVLSVEYTDTGATWGGIAFDFGSADISAYSTLVLSIDTSGISGLAHLGIKLEDSLQSSTEVDLFSFTPTISGNWATYEIPLSVFPGANLTDVKYLGLWNPQDDTATLTFGTLYFDDIHLLD